MRHRNQAFFKTLKGADRYAILYRIGAVKGAETRARKVAEFVAMLERARRCGGEAACHRTRVIVTIAVTHRLWDAPQMQAFKRLMAALLISVSLTAPSNVQAQEKTPPQTPAQQQAAEVRAQVNAANIQWVDAVRRQDFAMLSRIMAPDYVVIFHNGERADLPTWMKGFRKFRMLDCGGTIINMRVTGPDSAEATVTAYWDAVLADGKPFRETFSARDSWRRRDARWVVVQRDVMDRRLLN